MQMGKPEKLIIFQAIHSVLKVLLLALVLCCIQGQFVGASISSFNENFYVNWAESNVRIGSNSESVQLTLNRESGSGFASIHQYLFGRISMQIKLVPGNSAGTVTAYYMSSQSSSRDEIDFEFLGNLPGQPYILQTNVFASGTGNREQRIHLWFDPTADYHTYSIMWNRHQIAFMVDSIPIRAFLNNGAYGVPYPNSWPMSIFSTLWNGESWATEGGRVKVDWTAAPFVASFRNFDVDACMWESSSSPPACTSPSGQEWWNQAEYESLSSAQITKLKWVKERYMFYDYCNDKSRFSTPPLECAHDP